MLMEKKFYCFGSISLKSAMVEVLARALGPSGLTWLSPFYASVKQQDIDTLNRNTENVGLAPDGKGSFGLRLVTHHLVNLSFVKRLKRRPNQALSPK
jgi:hypothetical protein